MARDNLVSSSQSGDTDGFGLIKSLRNSRLGGRVASLVGSSDMDPNPQAFSSGTTDRYSADLDRARPDDNVEYYYEEYKENPIINTQINSFASDCWEGGWHITADSEKTKEELEEFCKNIGIKSGQVHQSISKLGKTAIEQHQARGTFLGEKMYDEQGRPVGINPMNCSTVEIYTKYGVNILAPPDYNPDRGDVTLKKTDEGETAAYVQFDERITSWGDRKERRFTRNEMLHWARRPDIGDVFGNSRVQPVLNRSRALREKLNDNDLAIAMKAWPMVLFQMGTAERPWTLDQMEDFMGDYTEGELGPGMFQGVPGDIEVKEFAGETADIAEPVMTDVNMIVSAMPGPKHSTGSFPGEEGTPTKAHERQYTKLVRETRLQLENLFTPYLKDVAEAWGYDSDGVRLHVGRPEGEVAPEDIQGNIIRYDGVSDGDEDDDDGLVPTGGSEGTPDSTNTGSDNDEAAVSADAFQVAEGTHDSAVADEKGSAELEAADQTSVATLADPSVEISADTKPITENMIGIGNVDDELGEVISEVLTGAREGTIDTMRARYGGYTVPSADSIASEFESQVGERSRRTRLSSSVRESCETVKSDTLSELSDRHGPTKSISSHSTYTDATREKIIGDIRDLASEMANKIRQNVRDMSEDDQSVDAIETRLSSIYSDAMLEQRSRLVAQMRLQELLNTIKLEEYRSNSEIDGVSLETNCTDDTHRLTAELSDCEGEREVVLFEDLGDRSVAEGFASKTSVEPLADFRPLTGVPPFGYGSQAELIPIQHL